MANLLPQNLKKEYRKEYVLRAVAVWLFAFAVVTCIGMILLVPTYVLLEAKLNNYAPANEENTEVTAESSTEMIKTMNEYVALLKKDSSSRGIPYGIFARLFELKGKAITISRLSFSSVDGKLSMTGKAATRNDLKEFIDRIGEDEAFLPIENFPYADLSEPRDISFNLNIQLDEQIQP